MVLFLADLEDCTEDEIKEHIAVNYAGEDSGFDYGNPTDAEIETLRRELKSYNLLVAYESVGDYGCDSASYFLMQRITDDKYFEFSGSHCSCYGFEGQYDPDEVTVEYFNSDRFTVYLGGYDGAAEDNKRSIEEYVKSLEV